MTNSRGQAGITLLELLVALTILLIVATGALTTYENTAAAFKQGGIAAAQQQGVRSAFDQITRDLQLAGLNVDPDGDPDRTDEPVEAAYDTAIVIRADFDKDDPVLSLDPETSLATGSYEVVTSGNDEIVAYVLAKPDWSGSIPLQFWADTKDSPRGGSLEWAVLPGADMVQDRPPYTLYRVTLSNDTSDWGTYDFFDRTVVAENIGSLKFRYFDAAGNSLNPVFDLSSVADDIGGGGSQNALRARIRRIEIDIVGLAVDTDPNWVDWKDSNPATRQYRKFRLISDFRIRNQATVGLVDRGDGEFGAL